MTARSYGWVMPVRAVWSGLRRELGPAAGGEGAAAAVAAPILAVGGTGALLVAARAWSAREALHAIPAWSSLPPVVVAFSWVGPRPAWARAQRRARRGH